VQLNRKVLSEIAVHEPRSFQALATLAKQRHDDAMRGLAALAI
jgi:ribosomal protein L20